MTSSRPFPWLFVATVLIYGDARPDLNQVGLAASPEAVAHSLAVFAPPDADDGGEPALPADSDDEVKEKDSKLRKLTTEEINRIRFMELRGMRIQSEDGPDRVQVKIPKDTIDEFLVEMEGHPDFRGKRNRREFLKKTAPQKLHTIARYKGAPYADKVEILTDPEVFVEFRRQILPIVLRSCVTNECHASTNDDSFGFELFNDPKRTAATTYANFLVLNELQISNHRMIERGQPENSLLLTYMLPPKDVLAELRHPGDVEIKPLYPSRKSPGFRRLEAWIASLKHPSEDYGVQLLPPPEAPVDAPQGASDKPPDGGDNKGVNPPNPPLIHWPRQCKREPDPAKAAVGYNDHHESGALIDRGIVARPRVVSGRCPRALERPCIRAARVGVGGMALVNPTQDWRLRLSDVALMRIGHSRLLGAVVQAEPRLWLMSYAFETGFDQRRKSHSWRIVAAESNHDCRRAVLTREPWLIAMSKGAVTYQAAVDGADSKCTAKHNRATAVVWDLDQWRSRFHSKVGAWFSQQPSIRSWEIVPGLIVGHEPGELMIVPNAPIDATKAAGDESLMASVKELAAMLGGEEIAHSSASDSSSEAASSSVLESAGRVEG